jgi:hypothetical protein
MNFDYKDVDHRNAVYLSKIVYVLVVSIFLWFLFDDMFDLSSIDY